MKFGPIEVYYNPSKTSIIVDAVREYLRSEEVSRAVYRMARSEVKNYMAEVCEAADVPFEGPEKLVHTIGARP